MKKITMATVKSFICKNFNELYIQEKSKFDGMIDGTSNCKNTTFVKVQAPDEGYTHDNHKGVHGAWFVGGSRDHLSHYETETMIGIDVYNCCGHFILAIAKA